MARKNKWGRFKGLGTGLMAAGGAAAGFFGAPLLIPGGYATAAIGGLLGASVGAGASGNKKAGRWWDTHFGRSGIGGEGLEMLGLGKSGTTADRDRGLLRALDKDITNVQKNAETSKHMLWNSFNTNTYSTQRKGGSLLSAAMNTGNVSNDTSRNQNRVNTIQDTIRSVNENYANTIIKSLDRDKATADRVQTLETRKENIRRT